MTNTPDILKKIITRKEAEVAECKKNISETKSSICSSLRQAAISKIQSAPKVLAS
jgi:hypothetical protein